jgi:hypothetical protein
VIASVVELALSLVFLTAAGLIVIRLIDTQRGSNRKG